MKVETDHILETQAIQLLNAQQHLQIGNAIVETQKVSLSYSQQLKDKSAELASELDGATKVAGRMSARLDHVDQALTRVERASSVLSALFALLAGPARVAEVLHLRLLGLFAMPTMMLYYCKPKKQYSYILASIYRKLSYRCSI